MRSLWRRRSNAAAIRAEGTIAAVVRDGLSELAGAFEPDDGMADSPSGPPARSTCAIGDGAATWTDDTREAQAVAKARIGILRVRRINLETTGLRRGYRPAGGPAGLYSPLPHSTFEESMEHQDRYVPADTNGGWPFAGGVIL